MLTADQKKNLISANASLLLQLEEANAILEAREEEIDYLRTQLAELTALRSKMDGQQEEIEKFHYLLYKKDEQAEGAIERETGLQQELNGLAGLNKKYNELLQDYAYLSIRFTDAQARLTALNERNFELEQVAGKIGELESILENSKIEREELKKKITSLELEKYI